MENDENQMDQVVHLILIRIAFYVDGHLDLKTDSRRLRMAPCWSQNDVRV